MADQNDALALIFIRNAFYRRLHYLTFAAFLLTIMAIGVLSVILVFLVRHPRPPVYFAANSVGQLIKTVPTNVPNMSNDDVIKWTTEAIQQAYSYDFVNYRVQLQTAQKYFTTYGWDTYMRALTASNNLLALTNRKQIVIAQVVGPPKILAQGLLAGSYAWKFQFPLLVTYWEPPFDTKTKFFNAISVSVIVQRQPILNSYKGLGVVQMIAEMAATTNQPQEISSTSTG